MKEVWEPFLKHGRGVELRSKLNQSPKDLRKWKKDGYNVVENKVSHVML